MNKIALVFPGQGSQYVGMGKDIYEIATAKQIIDRSNEILGFDIKSLMFNGPEEKLTDTRNAQPAIVTLSIALFYLLKEKVDLKFEGVAGHSLGEYSAYIASGRLSFEDGIKLVKERGHLMSEVEPGKGGMAAVMRIDDEEVEKICSNYDKVVPANYNCPGQIVISGDKKQMDEVIEKIKEKGGRAIPLSVSGAFHSPLMKDAAKKFREALNLVNFNKSDISLYSNVNALPVKDGEERELLEKQIYSSVRWTQTINNMIKDGFTTFIEVGPGKVLTGLIKKINKDVTVFNISDIASLNSFKL
ncbi:MAG TPA: ACP S-malonyltransferase [Spirochaetota bacterium]|nr:ACP S-malonyltransferase [Spirochaetota bacterium]HOM38064.1 ACP S-malonyltransferase [Spirochaetota bacterium]HPQ48867.1 ACP S-malonyltransferase [Spirochaetota bacterium]